MTAIKARTALTILAVVLLLPAVSSGEIGNIKLDQQKHSKEQVGVGPVTFPHARHEKLNKCADCHPKIFIDKAGANKVTMKGNMEGKFCGSPNCHNSPKAFPLFECAKCHAGVKKIK